LITGVLLAWKEETSSLGESCKEREAPGDGCVRESWAAAAMVFPSCTGGEGRTGGLGLGAGRRRRERSEARPGQAGGRLP